MDWRTVCPDLISVYENLCTLTSGSEVDGIMERIAFEIARLRTERDAAREALISLVEEFERLTRYGSPFAKANNPRIVAAKAALSRLSSPGAQQRAGEDGG
jgi:hypothetical protein